MTIKFSSKEIHFLKPESDGLKIQPPEIYFCDLLLTKSSQVKAFEKRLSAAKIPEKKFLCAVIQISSDASESIQEKAKDTFEATFNAFLDKKRGLWERLNDTSFVLAFWDYASVEKGSGMIVSLKDKISIALKADILVGIAQFPLHDFSVVQTFENALKARDHAAFFGPDTLIHFDATSLNISGDRLYQLGRYDRAIIDYQKGLEINPNEINLINSLGVCYGVMGKLDQARLEFKKAMAVNSNEPMVIYNIGLLYHIEDDIDNAIIYLKKAHGIEPLVFEIELLLGQLLTKKGLPELAMPHIEAANRIDPVSGLPFRMKGEIFLADNHPEKADHEFNKAIKLNPADAVSLSGYANSLELQEKNLNIALTFAKNSIALDPDNELFKKRLKAIQDKIEENLLVEDTIKTA